MFYVIFVSVNLSVFQGQLYMLCTSSHQNLPLLLANDNMSLLCIKIVFHTVPLNYFAVQVNIPLLVIGTKSDVASERRSLPIHQKRCNHFSDENSYTKSWISNSKAYFRIRPLKGQCREIFRFRIFHVEIQLFVPAKSDQDLDQDPHWLGSLAPDPDL
jgi:hypothetical protein